MNQMRSGLPCSVAPRVGVEAPVPAMVRAASLLPCSPAFPTPSLTCTATGSVGTATAGILMAERQDLEAQQDSHLDELHASATRLTAMSHAIHAELAEQEVLIDEATGEIDDVSAAVEATNARVAALVAANGGPAWCAGLAGLSCVAFLLFLLILAGA